MKPDGFVKEASSLWGGGGIIRALNLVLAQTHGTDLCPTLAHFLSSRERSAPAGP